MIYKYLVSFEIASDYKWEELSYGRLKSLITGKSFLDEKVIVPAYADITELVSPYEDGYYLIKGSSNVFKKKGVLWFISDSSMNWIHLESATDDYIRSQSSIFLAPLPREVSVS